MNARMLAGKRSRGTPIQKLEKEITKYYVVGPTLGTANRAAECRQLFRMDIWAAKS